MPSDRDTHDVLDPQFDYHSLSLLDLIQARDVYHLHLTKRKGAIATAIGCYLIRQPATLEWFAGRGAMV